MQVIRNSGFYSDPQGALKPNLSDFTAARGGSLASDPTVAQALKAAEGIGLTKVEIATHAYTSELWLLFSGIGVLCIIGLLLFQKFVASKSKY